MCVRAASESERGAHQADLGLDLRRARTELLGLSVGRVRGARRWEGALCEVLLLLVDELERLGERELHVKAKPHLHHDARRVGPECGR